MKRILVLILAALALSAVSVSAKSEKNTFSRFGVIGGVNSDKLRSVDDLKAGWHAGLTWELNLPLYFSIQPTVLYQRNNTQFTSEGEKSDVVKMNDITIPVAVQWGPDLGVFRPYFQVVPYADFVLGADVNSESVKESFKNAQFGCGVGVGIDIWKLQISGRYNWSFGDWNTISDDFAKALVSGTKQGFNISLAFFF